MKPFSPYSIVRKKPLARCASGQAMVEYVVVAASLMVLVVGSHSAWEAMNGNRIGMAGDVRDVNGQDYTNVVRSDGTVSGNSIAFKDAMQVKQRRTRDLLSEITY